MAIASLDAVAWQHSPGGDSIPDGFHAWRQWCEHALVYVARSHSGGIEGAILAFPCLNGDFCLHKVIVSLGCRGQGLGSRLFEVMLAEMDRRGSSSFLTVDPKNEPAVRLYQKWGYVASDPINNYYGPGKVRVVMRRAALQGKSYGQDHID